MVTQNSINNTVPQNNFTVVNLASGANADIAISNTSNTAGSNAALLITAAGALAGDAFTQYSIFAVQAWASGVDNSDSQAFVIAASSTLGTSNVFRISTAGAPTFPMSPLDIGSGGTLKTSFTAYAPICGGTGPTTALQSASTGIATAGFALLSNGSSTLPSFQAISASGAITTINGDSGSITATAGAVTISGGTSGLTTIGSVSTLNLTGTLNVGHGGTASASFNTTGVVITGATSTTALTSVTLTDGQLAIGSSIGNPAAATITAGSGISVTNGHNSITIASSAGPSPTAWNDENSSFPVLANTGYFVTATATATLPAAPSQGDTVYFIVDTTSVLTVTANSGQVIRIGSVVSATAGTATSNARGDAVILTYRTTGAAWIARSAPQGIWTVT